MPTKIKFRKKLKAILIKSKEVKKTRGINFFTDNKLPIQVASMNHKKGHQIIPHTHKKIFRKINITSEVLIIIDGLIIVNFYNKKKLFKKLKLYSGDVIIFFGGTHGFEIKKNSRFIEVKQGPYYQQDIDKETFTLLPNKKVEKK